MPIYSPTGILKVEKILTEEEFDDLFCLSSEEEEKAGKPSYFDDNSDEWVKWLYKNGYRLVKVAT